MLSKSNIHLSMATLNKKSGRKILPLFYIFLSDPGYFFSNISLIFLPVISTE